MGTHFTGPVTSTNGFVGSLTLADPLTTTGLTISTDGAAVTGASTFATSVAVGGGTAITKVVKGTIAVNPSSLDTLTGEILSLTITGAAVGDIVVICPAAAGFTQGILLGGAWVSATNTVKLQVFNSTGGTLNEASATCDYVLIRS